MRSLCAASLRLRQHGQLNWHELRMLASDEAARLAMGAHSSADKYSQDSSAHGHTWVGEWGGLHASGGVCKAGRMLRSPPCKHGVRFPHPEKLVKSQGSIGSRISD